ncbi:MAG: C4-type zinc ribbon domain-containing protein [Sphingobacteriaceae bacterium]|jgi:predicted  nucleic acid-binding Zn-ribbon protein|nr:C4-type zinc ribbon domain-containing protein [Sphingobacteriaceae bacterium]
MESTIEQKLRALYLLQQIDTKIDQLRTLRGELPMEVNDLEDEIIGLETRLEKYNEDLGGLKKLIAEKQAFIKDANALKAKYEQQLMGVKNSREYDALSKEVEIQGLEIQIAEKKIREFNLQIEQRSGELQRLSDELAGRKKDLDNKKTELNGIIAETEKEEQDLITNSKKAEKSIEERLLTAYHRIRSSSRNGLAVVTVQRDACGGCFNQIPPQRQMDIRTRKKIAICEHCGRILVDSEINTVEA